MSDKTLAWHFCADKLRDGSRIPDDGVVLRHAGKLELCASGLHASERIFDALYYAPGHTICRVEMGGEMLRDGDKLVASERTILWRIDGEQILREFSRWCALEVAHLWDMPDIVRRYLETGDESIRDAARAAAWAASLAAARAAARGAARDAAWAAARDAARAAAWAAARDAARAAARAAAWAAAWAAARDAARAAAWAAARDAARAAARAAAWDAARDAAWDKFIEKANAKLEQMAVSAREDTV